MFSRFVFVCLMLISLQTSNTSSAEVLTNCHPNIDIRFGNENNNQSTQNKKPHAEVLSYNDIAYAFLSTANLALKFAGNECRQDVCLLAKSRVNLNDINNMNDIAIAYTALYNMPYGLRLLLCSDVIIRSIVVQEILFADEQHDNKLQTARTKSVENEPYKWRFEPVDGDLNRLQFRIRNMKTNQYLVADRKFSSLSETLRRIVMTDPKKSDVWELKMMSDLNGNFNRFMIMNVPLGEYLYAARGFCYDKISNTKDCKTRPLFTWEYKTFKEAEEDEYNKFIIDEFVLD